MSCWSVFFWLTPSMFSLMFSSTTDLIKQTLKGVVCIHQPHSCDTWSLSEVLSVLRPVEMRKHLISRWEDGSTSNAFIFLRRYVFSFTSLTFGFLRFVSLHLCCRLRRRGKIFPENSAKFKNLRSYHGRTSPWWYANFSFSEYGD